jgi:hypothetical protein
MEFNGYAAFSLSHMHRENAIAYVKNQKQHHTEAQFNAPWERTPDDMTDTSPT